MRAMLCHEPGSRSNLRLETIGPPSVDGNSVHIQVEAAGVNFPDILMLEGKYQVKPPLPFSPGLEVAGTVVECGAGITHVAPGDRVLAFARRGGGYASNASVPGGLVAALPDEMDFVSAAAFPVAYGTAHFALTHRGRLQPGETLLVLGAAGGVGVAAVEMGKMLGATVIAAARGPDKLAVAREHGADHVIDYEAESLRDRVKELTDGAGADLVFDPVGGDHFEQCVRCIGWEGRILVVGFASGTIPRVATNLILVKNFSVVGVVFGAHSEKYPADFRTRMQTLFAHYRAGRFRPRIWRTFALEAAADALTEIASRRVNGKVVLTIGTGE